MKEQKAPRGPLPHTVYCRIAGHLMGIYWPGDQDIRKCLPSFVDFFEKHPGDGEAIAWVDIRISGAPDDQEEKQLLSDVSAHWGDRFRFEESDRAYITTVESEGGEQAWKMVSTKDFRQSVLYAVPAELHQQTILSWMLMLVYGQAAVPHHTVLIHASVIKSGSVGVAFLGKSGTGKSTHSRLWLAHIRGAELLNDDNPVVRMDEQGSVWIYGSPWSGKTLCYRNSGVRLGGLVRLRQARRNRWTSVSATAALLALLPSCTAIRWNKKLFASMVDVAEEIAATVPVAYLDCLPDQAAVELCRNQLTAFNP